MEAKFVNEALVSDTRSMIENFINTYVKTKNTRAKLYSYLEAIYAFTEETPTINKKELTKIYNDLSNVVTSMYNYRENRDEQRNELDELAKARGYRSAYEASQERKDPAFLALSNSFIYSLTDTLRNVKRFDSIDLNEKELAFIEKYYPNLRVWADLTAKIEEIRTLLNPTKEQRQEKELREIKGKVNPEIKTAIDEIAENFRKVIEDNEFRNFTQIIQRLSEMFPDNISSNAISHPMSLTKEQRNCIVNASHFIVKKLNNYTLKDDALEIAKKSAYEISVDTIVSWQFKMYNKLGGFISELGKKFEVTVFGKLRNNTIYFDFEDGSHFSIKNQIVAKRSNLGTFFYTYPTTFHTAFLPNKVKIVNPNEYTVKKAFNDFKS